MSGPELTCPHCSARAEHPGPRGGRVWCTACDTVFDAPPAPRRPDRDDEPDERPRHRRNDEPASALPLIGLIAGGLFIVVGLGVGAYLLTKKDPAPPQQATQDPPKPAPPTPKPVAAVPPKVEPPRPKPPSPEEIVRRVKGSTVYIRTDTRTGVGMGTGFFAGDAGYVVTNAHVVGYGPTEIRPARRVEVVVASGETDERAYPARVFGVDAAEDLALLHVDSRGLPAPLAFGKAADLVETQDVTIYGYPFGELLGKNISVNRSTVSSLRKQDGRLVVVQLAGGLNPGNSGGPVTNAKGEVVGVSVARLRGSETIAFAIPAETAAAFAEEQTRSGGRIRTGNLVAARPDPDRPPVVAPPKKPIDPPIPAPARFQPAAPPENPDRVYVPKDGPEQVVLPDPVDDVAVGGGGRYLVLRPAGGKRLAVFDVWAAKIVGHVPLAEDTPHFAAGRNRLVVVYHGAKLIQFWNLATLEKEKSAPLPDALTADGIHQVCMGSGSDGPLFVYLPKEKRTYALDLEALRPTEVRWKHWGNQNAYGPLNMRASGDGSVLGGWGGGWAGNGVAAFKDGKQVDEYSKYDGTGPSGARALPSADGRHVYLADGVMNRAFTRAEVAGAKNSYLLPAVEPGFFLALLGATGNGRDAPVGATVYTEGRQKLFSPRLDELTPHRLPWEKRVFYYPTSGLLLTLDPAGDRLILRRAVLDEELEKSGAEYLVVTSRPPAAVPGKRFEYQIGARSKKGGVKFKLDFGPDGFAVSVDGKVTWDVPAGFGKPESVAVTVSDSSGQEVIHAFELAPAR